MTNTVAQFLGPAIATGMVLGLGAGWAFALDAATFAVSAAFLMRLRPRGRGEAAVRAAMVKELAEGWQAVRSRSWVWAIIGSASLVLLTVVGPLTTLGPSVAEEHYGQRGIYGWMMAVFGAGTLVGSITAAVPRCWSPGRWSAWPSSSPCSSCQESGG